MPAARAVQSTRPRPAEADAGERPPPERSAKEAGLRYVTDGEPGLRRVRHGRGFRYEDAQGKPVKDKETLARIRRLAIPPAWTDVWICPDGRGHVQATGRDARGRKQYRYHPRWRETRDDTKYSRLLEFAAALPRVRERVERDLALPGLPREKVVACIVRLLESTAFRVGNEEYARANGSHGLTTLRDQHVKVEGASMRFRFRGKSGKVQETDMRDARLARIVKRCQDLPGQVLFQYLDDEGAQGSVGSADVNDYLRDATGQDFTAKDFRTWAGTVLCLESLQELGPADTRTEAKKRVVEAVKCVAEHLGNTPAVCRRGYIHPEVMQAYLDGDFGLPKAKPSEDPHALRPEEEAVVALLERRLARKDEPLAKTLERSVRKARATRRPPRRGRR